ncbi:MAG: hypothetical protein DME17_14355 [Candidatus Rokuibacteriota bacterium]|nr:MAG: hypothetical protein DME17_14355 [Candidatus Rokubacteria bacterium]
MGTAQKSRYVTRQRDGIRTIGWCSIGLAPLVLAAPMVDLEAERDALLRLCQSGLGWACLRPDANGTAPWLAAVSLLGFGILLLAIRRPVRSEERIDCPFCAEPIRVEAVLCPHCRSEFDRGRDRVSRGR